MWLPCVDGPKGLDGEVWIGNVGKMEGIEFSQSDLALSVVKYITSAVSDASLMPVQVIPLPSVARRNAAWLAGRRAFTAVDIWSIYVHRQRRMLSRQ